MKRRASIKILNDLKRSDSNTLDQWEAFNNGSIWFSVDYFRRDADGCLVDTRGFPPKEGVKKQGGQGEEQEGEKQGGQGEEQEGEEQEGEKQKQEDE